MKAAVFYGKHDLRVEERTTPTPKAGEVLVKIHACGICGTDVHIYNGDEGAAKCPSGTVIGHEFAGEVVAVGDGVTDLAIGTRVCVDPNVLCGKCDPCLGGYGHFCTDMTGIGTTVDGGFAEYCVAPRTQIYPFSDKLDYAAAAMTEPVACCLHGIDLCEIQAGSTVAVIGCGMIGLLMLQLAQLRGAAKVIAIEPVAEKREQAKALGAYLTIDPTAGDVAEALEKANVGRIRTVIECAGRVDCMETAIRIAGVDSVVMLFGLTEPDATLPVKPFELFKKEIVLKASFINPYTQKRALALIESGAIDVSSMVHQILPLSELEGALADPAKRRFGKLIIDPQK